MIDFKTLLEIVGSSTRLHLLELLSERARSLNELARSLGVTQQAVLKHLAILERNGIIKQTKLDSKSRVRSVYAISKPLSLGYTFNNGILCLYIGSGEYNANTSADIETLKGITYKRNLLRLRTKVAANRLKALVEEDLMMQAETNGAIKRLKLTPAQTIALQCFLSMDSRKHLDEASKAFGLELKDTLEHITQSEG